MKVKDDAPVDLVISWNHSLAHLVVDGAELRIGEDLVNSVKMDIAAFISKRGSTCFGTCGSSCPQSVQVCGFSTQSIPDYNPDARMTRAWKHSL